MLRHLEEFGGAADLDRLRRSAEIDDVTLVDQSDVGHAGELLRAVGQLAEFSVAANIGLQRVVGHVRMADESHRALE